MIVGIALLASPVRTLAQRGGGGGHGMPAGAGAGVGIASGVSDKDDLKDFHQAMAVQATDEQRAAFAKIAQYTQAASDRLKAFRDLLQKVPASSPLSDRATTLDQAIEKARVSNRNFLASFSSKQKSGLKDIAKKLEKADSDLDKEVKALDQIVQIVQTSKSDTEPIASSAASLDKELASFQEEQLALGREMGILLSTGSQDLTFNLPKVTNSINIAGQPVSIQASGAVSRQSTGTPAENGRNLFTLKLTADLSDVQQNITVILRSKLTRSPRCGERMEIQQATLTPLAPASLVVARVHLRALGLPAGSGKPYGSGWRRRHHRSQADSLGRAKKLAWSSSPKLPELTPSASSATCSAPVISATCCASKSPPRSSPLCGRAPTSKPHSRPPRSNPPPSRKRNSRMPEPTS